VTRPRPQVHFTAESGWINDPYGIAWIGDRYHLYYQAVPGSVTWAANCHWGHAQSVDLVRWVEQPVALAPQAFEVGCWSGSVVQEADPPTIFYTRVVSPEDIDMGQVAVARLDATGAAWRSTRDDVVVETPPPELGVRLFRDPYVVRTPWGWRMYMAAVLGDGRPAVLQYGSDDLQTWSFAGVVCTRTDAEVLWECPHLFPLEDQWVLIVSVGDVNGPSHVEAAVGVYDGDTFQAHSWQRLTYGSSAYAMTAFLDRAGRQCVLSWLREEGSAENLLDRAGAHSIASVLTLDAADQLVMQPHPDLEALRGPALTAIRDRWQLGDGAAEVGLPARDMTCEIVESDRVRAALSIDVAGGVVSIDRPGFGTEELPLDGGDVVRVIVDADTLEVFSGCYGAYRMLPADDPAATTIVINGAGDDDVVIRPLRVG
jgi:beta-fructofuranosidase